MGDQERDKRIIKCRHIFTPGSYIQTA